MALVDGCCLSPEERLLLNSLSVFNCPIPHSLVVALAGMIADSIQKPSLAGTLHCKLMKFKLLLDYPHPVVLHESILTDSTQQDDFEFVHLPHHVSHCIWKSLEEIDQVVVLSLVYHALNIWYQTRSLKKFSTRCLFSGLCSSLLEMCDSNFTLIGKKCYQEIYSLFLSCTT
ncbi:MAG: hypothetical protein MJE68_04765 [Proteobacteria bacterium]|nr:hypothetical protein [Pseudomonadota bacterium]